MPNVDVNPPTYREGKILKMTIKFDPKTNINNWKTKYNGTLNIYDSLLVLPVKLENLSNTFIHNYKNKKTIFPLKYLNNSKISLNYEGNVPDLKYFYHPSPYDTKDYIKYLIKYSKYKSLFKGKWNLKKELVNYCEQDSVALHNILKNFAKEIFKKYKVNILKCPTITSIAFKIYRSKYMLDENIANIKGSVYKDIKQAYYGGFVDVYRPFAEFVKSFDVNSLYPFAM